MSFVGIAPPIEGVVIPPEWYEGVVEGLDRLWSCYLKHQDKLDCIERSMDILCHYARFISAGRGIYTITIIANTTPRPLFMDEMEVRRIVIKVPSTATQDVFIGDEKAQEFMLSAGEKEEVFVKDPRKVYIKATGSQKVFALFELAQ